MKHLKINTYINKSKSGIYTITVKHCGKKLESTNYNESHYIDNLREARDVSLKLWNKWHAEMRRNGF